MATDNMPISMTWAQWKMIDATMDNTASIASVDGNAEVADRASAIRAAGWAETGHIDRPYMDRGEWPPPAAVHSEPVAVPLSTDDWAFVLDELRRWSEVGGEPSDDDRTIVLLITAALHAD